MKKLADFFDIFKASLQNRDMNFVKLKQFIREILLSAPCPHCQKKMGIGKVEILNVDNNRFAFRTECEHCGAEPIIQGNIRSEVQSAQKLKNSFVTPKTIQGLRETMTRFSGKDVNDLFKK